MSDTDLKDTKAVVAACDAASEQLSESQQDLARDVLSRLSGKWPLWVLHVLAAADGPMRFTHVLAAVEGITQKVLTRTLRQLECDGLITRTLYPQVPPRVDYALTALGSDLLVRTAPLFAWVITEVESFAAARSRFLKPELFAPPDRSH